MRIVVVGDVLLDVDIDGEATRLSPDAPVPVVDVSSVQRRAGGAGLVARMLAGDGRNVTLVTVLADDDAGLQLERALDGITVVAGSQRLRRRSRPACGRNATRWSGSTRAAPARPYPTSLRPCCTRWSGRQ